MPAEQLAYSPAAAGFDGWFGGTRIVFGRGSFDAVGHILEQTTLPAPIAVVATPSQVQLGRVDLLVRSLGDSCRVYADASDHTAADLVAAAADALSGCRSIVAVGGGAAIGLAKATAAGQGLPFAVIPTTYSGSEMTEIYGVSSHGIKTVRRSELARARTVIYDPDLFESLPPRTAQASLLNCVAHCIEAVWIKGVPPLGLMTALESCRLIGQSRGPEDLVVAAWLGGVTLSIVGVAVHHTMCHVLGAATGVPHAVIHAIVLPESMWLNRNVALPQQHQLVSALCGSTHDVPHDAVRAFRRECGLPHCLREVWSGDLDVGDVVEKTLASAATARNAASITREELTRCFERVLDGV